MQLLRQLCCLVVQAVRQPLYWAADPVKRLGARGDYLSDPLWLKGFERIAAAGLVWDLLVYDEQLPSTHELITSFPDTTFVLEAAGWPLDLTAEGFCGRSVIFPTSSSRHRGSR